MGMETWTTAESSLSHWQKIWKILEEILVTHFQNFAKFNLIYILVSVPIEIEVYAVPDFQAPVNFKVEGLGQEHAGTF